MSRRILTPRIGDKDEPLWDNDRVSEAWNLLTPEEQNLLRGKIERHNHLGRIPAEPEPDDFFSYRQLRDAWQNLGESSGYDIGYGGDYSMREVSELLTPEGWDEVSYFLDNYEAAFQTWKTKDYHTYMKAVQAYNKWDEEYDRLLDEEYGSEGFKYQNSQISSMQALGLVGTAIGFGSFGYSVVRLYERNWKAAVGGLAVGAVALSLVGWNMNKLKDTVPFMADGDFMNPKDVEKILDESRGKIVSVTFIKRTTGEERTLVGRIGKNYKPTGTDPLGGKAERRKRNLFTIYDMQKGGFRMVSMDSVLSIKAAGKRHHG